MAGLCCLSHPQMSTQITIVAFEWQADRELKDSRKPIPCKVLALHVGNRRVHTA